MKIFITALLLFTSSSLFADAFEDDLKELFELTSIKNNYIRVNTFIINQMQTAYLKAAEETINVDGYTEEQKKKAGEILRNRFSRMVKNYENHISEVMPYEKVVQEVYIPLYKEVYTSTEVKQLITFYRSTVGQKVLDSTQLLVDQTSERIGEKYDPLVAPFMQSQIEEHIAIASREITSQIK